MYKKLICKKQLDLGDTLIQKEFRARGIIDQFNAIVVAKPKMVTRVIEALMADEKIGFKNCLNADLTKVGIEYTGRTTVGSKLSMLKDKVKRKEDNADTKIDWSVYEIDRVKYFKKISNEYNALSLIKI